MKKTNYHGGHTPLCDGQSTIEEYVQSAIEKGFYAIGFTGHAPLPYENEWTMQDESLSDYFSQIDEAARKYGDKIIVLRSLELDYIKEMIHPRSPKYDAMKLDYRLGSVHALKSPKDGSYNEVDYTNDVFYDILHNHYDGNIKQLVHNYYQAVREMVEYHTPDLVGHLDLIKKNNKGSKYFSEDEDWYKEEVVKTLDVCAKKDVVVEVNTGGLRKGATETVYPSPWILKLMNERNIKVQINSDAHRAEDLEFYFTESKELLKKAGYTEVAYFDKSGRHMQAID